MSNCWVPASTWVEALTKLNLIDVSLAIDVRKFNSAMSKSPLFGEVMHQFDGSNMSGVFRITFQKTFFYNFAEESRQVWYPFPLNSAWKEKVMEAAANVLVIPSTTTRSQRAAPITMMTAVDTGDTEEHNVEEESPRKRPGVGEHHIAGVANSTSGLDGLYWPCSPEAYQLFKLKKVCARLNDNCESTCNDDFDSETPMEAVQRQILLLQSVHDREDNWRNVVIGRDDKNVCTKAKIWEIQQRATFLCYAYQSALTKMSGHGKTVVPRLASF